MTIRCKMRLNDVIDLPWGGQKATFRCEYDPVLMAEDVQFTQATPQGEAEFVVDNPKASAQLVIGGFYYFDISPADDLTAAE